MFTGIIRALCRVEKVQKIPGLTRYAIAINDALISDLQKGASIAIDGVCQTVFDFDQKNVWFEAIEETLKRTTLKSLEEGQIVHFERSARFGDEIGGHILSGHIFGTAVIEAIEHSPNNYVVILHCPSEWTKYLFPKGYVALHGTSLTIVEVNPRKGLFTVHLIPETLKRTTFGSKKRGDLINVEFDTQTQAIVDTLEMVLERRSKDLRAGCSLSFRHANKSTS